MTNCLVRVLEALSCRVRPESEGWNGFPDDLMKVYYSLIVLLLLFERLFTRRWTAALLVKRDMMVLWCQQTQTVA